jgi:hypothetical protein
MTDSKVFLFAVALSLLMVPHKEKGLFDPQDLNDIIQQISP